MDYLGNKRAIAGRVVAAVEGGLEDRTRFRVLDAFSGTAAVSAALRARGHRVLANDNLELCAAWARAALLVPEHPAFKGLQAELGLAESGAYGGVVARLDVLAKRQYAAYYHVLETIVRHDEPPLTGSTGLRPWRTHASDWCYKRRAPAALEALVTKSSAERVVLSYSEDGQIDHSTVLDVMGAHGSVSFKEFGLRRYRSSRLPHKGDVTIQPVGSGQGPVVKSW